MEEIRELSVPPDVETQGGTEILRLFVVDGALSLSMQRAFAEPDMWGQVLAELAHQVANVYGRETEISAAEALDDIRQSLKAAFSQHDHDDNPAIN